jgi:CRISPR-associated protein Csd2
MCKKYYDIRSFGAVMTNEINCGQVRGPVQMSFARSIDRIVTAEHTIAVCAARKEDKTIDEQIGIQGRKFTIPYGLYLTKGFVNPFLAQQTGFSDDDLELLFTALGNAPSHKLFEAVSAKKKDGVEVPRAFSDYEVNIDNSKVPKGVEVIKRI